MMNILSRRSRYTFAAEFPKMTLKEQSCQMLYSPNPESKQVAVVLKEVDEKTICDLHLVQAGVFNSVNEGKTPVKGRAVLKCYGTGDEGKYELNETWTLEGVYPHIVNPHDTYDYSVPDVNVYWMFEKCEFKSNRAERFEAIQREIREWESF